MGSVGGEKYRNLYLDGSWDGRWESLAVWKQHCRLTWESMGSGRVLAPPRRAPVVGPNQLTTPKALWMEAGMAGGKLAGWSQQGRLTWESMGSGLLESS